MVKWLNDRVEGLKNDLQRIESMRPEEKLAYDLHAVLCDDPDCGADLSYTGGDFILHKSGFFEKAKAFLKLFDGDHEKAIQACRFMVPTSR